MTEAVFAFLFDSWDRTNSLFLKRKSRYHYAISNLPWWATSVASYSFGIQNTTHHIPFASRATQWCFTIGVLYCYSPLTIYIAYELLGATLRTNTLPFLIPTDWLVSYGSQHHLLLFIAPCSLRHVEQCSSPYISFAVTSTGLISERYLAVVSRLVYVNRYWR